MSLDLDSLFTRALLANTAEPKHKGAKRSPSPERLAGSHYHELFANPENWEHKRYVAVVHQPSDTLVGNFAELLHKTVRGCRRLVRVEGPVAVGALEHVKGDGWLGDEPLRIRPPQSDEGEREVLLDLRLKDFGVFAPKVLATAFVEGRAVIRLEPYDETRFFSKDGSHQLTVPAGMNILPVLDLETRISLREWLAL